MTSNVCHGCHQDAAGRLDHSGCVMPPRFCALCHGPHAAPACDFCKSLLTDHHVFLCPLAEACEGCGAGPGEACTWGCLNNVDTTGGAAS